MKLLPKTENAPVVRIDFSDDAAWDTVKDEIAQPSKEGFLAHVDYVNDGPDLVHR